MIAELAQSAIVAAALAAGVARSMARSVLNPFDIRLKAVQKAQEKTEKVVNVLCTDVVELKGNVKVLHEGQNMLAARALTEARNTQKRISRTDGDIRRMKAEMADVGFTPSDEPPESGRYRKNE
jgi:hypothetical protein